MSDFFVAKLLNYNGSFSGIYYILIVIYQAQIYTEVHLETVQQVLQIKYKIHYF